MSKWDHFTVAVEISNSLTKIRTAKKQSIPLGYC